MEQQLLRTISIYRIRYGGKDYQLEVLKDEKLNEKGYGVSYDSGHRVPEEEAEEIIEQFKLEQ